MHYIRIEHKNIKMTIGQYAAIIRRVKAAPAGAQFPESLCGWWPATREEILRQFGQMVTDRINRLLPTRDISASRVERKRTAHLISHCRWCGSSLGEYKPHRAQFCDPGCRLSYHQ